MSSFLRRAVGLLSVVALASLLSCGDSPTDQQQSDDPPLGNGEPVFAAATDKLIVADNFDNYTTQTDLENAYASGRNVHTGVSLTTGRGGTGKAARLSYGIGFQEDILFGTEDQLGVVGDWNGTLPQVAGPYNHFYFSTWFRLSPGADPNDHDGTDSGIKGFMFWHATNRYESAANQLQQPGGTRFLKFFNNSNAGSGLNVWKTSDGLAPLIANYADGTFHRVTFEIRTHATDGTQRGAKIWLDGTLIYDDYGVNVAAKGGYSYDTPIKHFYMWGNFVSTAAKSSPFTIDFDDWIAWTK